MEVYADEDGDASGVEEDVIVLLDQFDVGGTRRAGLSESMKKHGGELYRGKKRCKLVPHSSEKRRY